MKGSSYLLLFGIFILLACKKDDSENVVSITPNSIVLSVIDPISKKVYMDGDTVRNSIEINIEEQNKASITKVDFFISDKLVGSATSSPFTYSWNSINEQDGKKIVKVIATDANGGKTEKSVSLFVFNVLLTLKVQDYIEEGTKEFIIFSNENGEVLTSSPLTNNTETLIKLNEPYHADKINITTGKVGDGYVSLRSYIGIKRGALWTLGKPAGVRQIKTVSIRLKNIPSFKDIYIRSNTSVKRIFNLQYDTVNMDLQYLEGSKLYVEVNKTEGSFHRLLEINNQEALNVDLNTINLPVIENVINVNSSFSPTFDVAGLVDNEKYTDGYYMAYVMPEVGKLKLRYPSTTFSKYSTYMSVREDSKKRFENNVIGAVPSEFVKVNSTVTIENSDLRNFKATFSGSFDRYLTFYHYTTPSLYVDWTVSSSRLQPTYKLPEVGDIIQKSFSNASMQFDEVIMIDSKDFEEKDQYFRYYNSYPSPYQNHSTYSVSIVFGSSRERRDLGKYSE